MCIKSRLRVVPNSLHCSVVLLLCVSLPDELCVCVCELQRVLNLEKFAGCSGFCGDVKL